MLTVIVQYHNTINQQQNSLFTCEPAPSHSRFVIDSKGISQSSPIECVLQMGTLSLSFFLSFFLSLPSLSPSLSLSLSFSLSLKLTSDSAPCQSIPRPVGSTRRDHCRAVQCLPCSSHFHSTVSRSRFLSLLKFDK